MLATREGQSSFICDSRLARSVNMKRAKMQYDSKEIFQHSRAQACKRLTWMGDFIDYMSVREIAIASNHLHKFAH